MRIYNFIKIYVLVLLFTVSGNMAFAQSVSGILQNSKSQALTGYTIKNRATGEECTSGKSGRFIISGSENDTLEVLMDGVSVDKLLVAGTDAIYNIQENPFIKVVDGAYGKIRRSTSSSAMDVLTADRIEATSFTNTHHTTIGQLAGLTTILGNGEPGSNGLTFRVRGNNTFGDNTPLVLVDGFESDFAHINNFEIENITVLKDAVATAMYGLRAANGVILITTKRGYVGKTLMKVNADYGIMTPTSLPEFVDAYKYASLVNQAHANDGLAPRYSQDQLDGYMADNNPYLFPNIDWQDEMLKSSSDYLNVNVEFRGGSKNVKYYTLIGYMFADGLLNHTEEDPDHSKANKFDRINFRTNADILLSSNLDLNIGIGGRIEERNDPQSGTPSIYYNIQNSPANRYVMYNEDGSFGGSNKFRANPMAEILGKGYTESHTRHVNFNLRLDYDMDFITKGLGASGEISFTNAFTVNERYTSSYLVYDRVSNTLPDGSTSISYVPFGNQDTPLGYGGRYQSQIRTDTYRLYLDYERTFGNHDVSAVLLYDSYKQVRANVTESYKFNGISFRANYGYKSKYFVDLVAAYNGSNSYNPDNQYGFFPAAGASWIVSNEDFLKSSKWLNYLKLRSSYGITGSSAGAVRFSYLPNYSGDGNYRYGKTGNVNKNGLSESAVVNPFMEWSNNHQLNAGFDAVLFNNVTLAFDYFDQTTTDILQSIDPVVTDMVGIDVAEYNYGEVENKGFEVKLGYSESNSKGASWFIEGNVGYAHNEVTKAYQIENSPAPKVGVPIGVIYGYVADGFYESWADIASSPVNTLHPVQPGDVKYKNIAGSDEIDEYDRTELGNSFPEWHFGVNLGAEVKGVYVSASFDGMQRDLMLNGHQLYRPLGGGGYNNISAFAADNHWTAERGNSALLPRLTVSDNYNNYLSSSLYLQDGSYVRLRTAELGYKFKESLVQRIKLTGAKIYVRGHNLAVWHMLDADIDPEVMSGHPLLKTFNVGLNVQF